MGQTNQVSSFVFEVIDWQATSPWSTRKDGRVRRAEFVLMPRHASVLSLLSLFLWAIGSLNRAAHPDLLGEKREGYSGRVTSGQVGTRSCRQSTAAQHRFQPTPLRYAARLKRNVMR